MDEDSRLKRSLGLGWLASSGVQPKKRKEIHGVSAASLVALKAQLAQTQQEVALVREGKLDPEELRARRRGPLAGLADRKNAGVAERDARDRAQLKSTSESSRLRESAEALERKAALYERLAAGEELPEGEEERYEVDFLVKQPLDTAELAAGRRGGGLFSSDMAQERQRREWEAEAEGNLAREADRERKREADLQLYEDVIRETGEDRRRAGEQKQQRAEAEARKRERLKAAFMQKQLQQLKQQQQQQKKQQQQQQGAAG